MARRTAKKESPASPVVEALKFISLAQREDSDIAYQTHCRFDGQYAMAFDGTLAAGFPSEHLIGGCPNTFKLLAALTRVKDQYSLTMQDGNKLIMYNAKFQATIDCLPPVEVAGVAPHPPTIALTDDWKIAADKAGCFITAGASTMLESSVYTMQGSIIGLTRSSLIEVPTKNWFPQGLVVPFSTIKALMKIPHKLTGAGGDQNAITFWFENGAWLRTQLFGESYPNFEHIYADMWDANKRTFVVKPLDLDAAIAAVMPHQPNGSTVYITNGVVQTHREPGIGAKHLVDGIPYNVAINGDQWLKASVMFDSIDLSSDPAKVYFGGAEVRGLFTVMNS